MDGSSVEKDFWNKIKQIDGISVESALSLASGQLDVYEKLLKIMTKEIVKCDEQLRKYLSSKDMGSFSIAAHSMKSSLANIGAKELSLKARELELSSDKKDADYCNVNLPLFLEKLNILNSALKEAFSIKNQNLGPIEIPTELPSVFKKLETAFDKMNFPLIDKLIESIDAMDYSDALKEKIDLIKDAALEMDYDNAKQMMRELLE